MFSSQCARFLLSSNRRVATSSLSTLARSARAGGTRVAPSSILTPGTAAVAATAAAVLVYAVAEAPDARVARLEGRIPTSGDVISAGTPIKEPATGILFPPLCNGYSFVGCGVRVKYGFVKVYAVGTYVDFLSMSPIKGNRKSVEAALLDPTYPRTIRIVMNRNLGIEKYTSAIVEALEPRMKGQDLDKLEEFKSLNPPVDLVQGAEIEMTIRGDTLLYKNAVGGVGSIRSGTFTKAMCDVYYGADPVSPTHKASVLDGIAKL